MFENSSDRNSQKSSADAEAIAFIDHFAGSDQFRALFREGMALVEETADYLDGDGRADVKALSRQVSLLYASESMRLTTRLMQIASWLLLQRAVSEREITQAQASEEKRKVTLDTLPPNTEDERYLELPEQLVRMIDRSLSLQRRVRRLDEILYNGRKSQVMENSVHGAVDRLSRAFAKG